MVIFYVPATAEIQNSFQLTTDILCSPQCSVTLQDSLGCQHKTGRGKGPQEICDLSESLTPLISIKRVITPKTTQQSNPSNYRHPDKATELEKEWGTSVSQLKSLLQLPASYLGGFDHTTQ